MHLSSALAEFWPAILVGIPLIVLAFVVVAGRHGEGGHRARMRVGWRRWRELSERAANFQARVILSIFYFTVMLPFGLWQGFLADRLGLKHPRRTSFWAERSTRDRTLGDARRQF